MKSTDLIKRLRANGWLEVRSRGSHVTFKKKGVNKIITVVHPQKDIPIGTLRKTLKIAGIE